MANKQQQQQESCYIDAVLRHIHVPAGKLLKQWKCLQSYIFVKEKCFAFQPVIQPRAF